jgi:hypothetical protein
MSCPPGQILNPRTLRCIRTTSRIAQDLVKQGVIADYLVPIYQPRKTYRQPRARKPCRIDQQRNPTTGRCRRVYQPQTRRQPLNQRRQLSEGSAIPPGMATVAPLGAGPGWIQNNCRNPHDVVVSDLPEIIRLHNRKCITATHLHNKVAAGSQYTNSELVALRTAMRRRNPAYEIPGRTYRKPPPEWQLYVASDFRSGPDYASVLIVDTTKAVRGPNGVEYPPESIRIDLGFIPLRIGYTRCSAQTVLELTHRLAATHRLLKSGPDGEWKPVAGFPYSKRHWETDGVERLTRLCMTLSKELSR